MITTFFDENMGVIIPERFAASGDLGEIRYLRKEFKEAVSIGPVDDVDWIPIVAQRGWLIITRDRKMLNRSHERRVLIDNAAAVVLISPADLTLDQMLSLLLVNADRLMELASSQPRPFAVQLAPDGTIRFIPLERET